MEYTIKICFSVSLLLCLLWGSGGEYLGSGEGKGSILTCLPRSRLDPGLSTEPEFCPI